MIVDCHFVMLQRNWIHVIQQAVFSWKIIKIGNYHKKGHGSIREKTTASEDEKTVRAAKR